MFYLVQKGQIPNSAPGVQGGTACRLFQDAELSPHASSYSSSSPSSFSYSYSSSLLNIE